MTETWIESFASHDQIVTVVREEVPSDFLPGQVGVAYAVSCTCGWQTRIATLKASVACAGANEHLRAHRPLTAEDIFDML